MGATAAVLLADGPPLAAYALAAVAATAVTITRPAQAVLMPSLARTPEELTAANVVAGWIESLSVLVAPALAGVLLGVGGAGTVFAVMAVVAGGAAVLVAPVAEPAAGRRRAGARGDARRARRSSARDPGPRALVWLLGVEALAIGALDVLYVVLAVGVLGHEGGTAGYLNAAFGAGGVVGIAVTVALVGRRRLAPALLAGSRSGPRRSPRSRSRTRSRPRSCSSRPPASGARPSTSPAGRCCSASRRPPRSHGCSACSKA